MGMTMCYSLMKYLLIIFNIIFLVGGASASMVAAWLLYDGRASETAAARAGLCAVCVWGGALAAGAVAALAGARRHSASLLATAFAILALCAVGEGCVAWWGAAHAPQLHAALRAAVAHTVRTEYGAVSSRTAALDAIQRNLHCCGEAGVRDWQGSSWARGLEAGARPEGDALDLSVLAPATHYWVPASCCAVDGGACEQARRVPAASRAAPGLHAAGCGARMLLALGEEARVPLALAGALLAAHALVLLLTLALCLRAHPHHAYKA